MNHKIHEKIENSPDSELIIQASDLFKKNKMEIEGIDIVISQMKSWGFRDEPKEQMLLIDQGK